MVTTITSTFDTSDDGWTIVGDVASFGYQASGGDPNGYFAWVDAVTGQDSNYVAPAEYLGDKASYYGGTLSYDILDTGNGYAAYDVQIVGDGHTLQYTSSQDSNFPTSNTWTPASVALVAGNFIDTSTGTAASVAEMQDVLANLTQMEIRAEYVDGPEQGGLDNVELASLPCYVTGTLIATAWGSVAVESLAAGDLIVTASGEYRPVRWIGHRRLDLTRHSDPEAVWPVRVRTGAFGDGLPLRDLWMSPGHCVFLEGVLVPIRSLINGASVVQVPLAETTYWHVELDSHDVLMAEGLQAESYLDTGNRSAFENGGAPMMLHPTFEAPDDGDAGAAGKCAPVRNSGPEVQKARRRLAARVAALGYATTTAPDLHVLADGRRIDPVVLGPKRLAFTLPVGVAALALNSRSFVPWHTDPSNPDGRVLGVSVKRLQIDGEQIDLRGSTLGSGWHGAEERPHHVQRWTNGGAALPAGARLVVVDLAGDGRYWLQQLDNLVRSNGTT